MDKNLTDSNTFGYSTLTNKKSIEDQLTNAIGVPYEQYREQWDNISSSESIPNYPILLNFELSPKCNLKCGMCITVQKGFYKKRGKNKISFEKYREIIDEGCSNGVGAVSLNGFNEPFLLKDISRYIKYARDSNIPDVYLSTNAIPLTDKLINEFIDAGLTRILISIDAFSKDTYQKMRGKGYDKVVRNVLKIVESRDKKNYSLPIVRVSFIRTAVNQHEEIDFLNFWNDKVDQAIVQKFSNGYADSKDYDQVEKTYRLEYAEPMETCYQPFQRLLIANNGNVYPCCSDYGDAQQMLIGNIYESSVKEIWQNDKMRLIQNTVNAEKSKLPKACYLCKRRQSA